MPHMECIISQEDIARRVRELGLRLRTDYEGTVPLVIGILNGAFIFTADLARAMNMDLQVDFVRAASYGNATSSCGEVRLSKDVEIPVAGRDLLLVEDIVDTGRTLARLKSYFTECGARSVRVCALIDKKERREVEVEVDYAGFAVEHGFLVGYGLDYAENYRWLPAIYHLAEI